MYLYSDLSANLLFLESDAPVSEYHILDADGQEISCPLLDCLPTENGFRSRLDASALHPWSPQTPVLYTLRTDSEEIRFGHCRLRTMGNSAVLLNESPIYLRGYIRGIVAHDHPNMTGGTLYDAARRNIQQAKKYGFNLVRFHSTIPSEEFVQAADELGLLIHMEIGFAYDYNEKGEKTNLSMSNEAWEAAILRYRNHPSVAIFCIGNEMHNSGHYPEVQALYRLGKKLAPGKLIMDNSGWGEYDRTTADVYCQHIAYFFPYKHHGDMFFRDDSWWVNGSVSDVPQTAHAETAGASAEICRRAVPVRPMFSHEALHYIDVPDYDALNAKFDAFAASVGEEYLKKYEIKKPRFLTELPKLIRRKGLLPDMPDYIAGSRKWKLMASKQFWEKLRLSPLCGFEMLQFSDCLKYENKNGIVDCFDDDKGIDPAWMRQSVDDLVLLADCPDEVFYDDAVVPVDLYASDFLSAPAVNGTLSITLDGEPLYTGGHFALAGGLQKLLTLQLSVKPTGQAQAKTLAVRFESEGCTVTNSWSLWFYPHVRPQTRPELAVESAALRSYLEQGGRPSDLFVTDSLTEDVPSRLARGQNVILFYEHGAERNTWQLPGALERFKPCIWDRGSNLGGMVYPDFLQKALASGRYFDKNLQPLLEAGSKVNLDHFPCPVEEAIRGIDKPVRDRMKGLVHGVKDFIDDDTLRRFSHLFSLRVGKGLLIVCSLRVEEPESPVVSNFLRLLVDEFSAFDTQKSISADTLRSWLTEFNARPIPTEDVMNHFWEIDNKLVEDTLFWEEAGLDLTKIG